ncbi:hypothetical protein M514_08601 [Trichuris suis]|uniref:Uncharacterized protein n=1 Tax=Trichuris suis TaxID=68888 RepID=A0A085LZY7_9BILA|nr:hypothetical protein M513_08601 [Trichuris suis]KFD63434.1 hypothetical protein M514_08601 [Trichuris suis]
MPEGASNSLSVDMLDLDDTESLYSDGEKEQPASGEMKWNFRHAPVELFNMFLSSIVLGSCLSVIGPTIPQLMAATNAYTFSAGVNMISANAFGAMIGVCLAACWLKRKYTSIFMPMFAMLCGMVTYVIPQTGSWLNCLLLFFVQGVLVGIIDRGRYNIGPSNLNQRVKTVLLLYLALSSGGVLPLVSISSNQAASQNDSPSFILPHLFRRQAEKAADMFRNASLNKIVTELSDILHLNYTNLTTSLAPQKPKYVDGTGLKTGQTYAERKQKELKQIQAKELTTSLAPDAVQLNSSTIVNETVNNVTFDGNASTTEQAKIIASAIFSASVTKNTASFTELATSTTPSIRETATIIFPHQHAPSAASDAFNVAAKAKPIFEFEEPKKAVSSCHSWSEDCARSMGQVLTDAAHLFPNAAPAYRTVAWINIVAMTLSLISCCVLFCGQKFWGIRHDLQGYKIAEVPQSQYTKAALFFSFTFIFFVTAAEALLTSVIAVFMVAQYNTTLQDGVKLCCSVWVFLCIGRLLFLPLEKASGRFVGACMGCSLLVAGGTVFNLSQELFALLNCLFACFLGPASPLAFCWLCKETGNPTHFVTFWSIAVHLSRAVVPALMSWLMDDHQARDYPFGALSMTLAAVVLLIPLDKAAKQSNQYFESIRRSGKRFDESHIAYSKLINKTKRDSDFDDERARAEEKSLFEI